MLHILPTYTPVTILNSEEVLENSFKPHLSLARY
jgi:hypothetical protein